MNMRESVLLLRTTDCSSLGKTVVGYMLLPWGVHIFTWT